MLDDYCTGVAHTAAPTAEARATTYSSRLDIDELPFLADAAWQVDEDLGALFGLTPAPDQRRRSCRNALIGSLANAVWSGHRGIFYPRDRNWYAANGNVLPSFVTLRLMTWAVDTMETAPSYFLSHRAAPARPRAGEAARHRSMLSPGPLFLEAAGALRRCAAPKPNPELVLLRDSKGRSRPFEATAQTTAIAAKLARYNAMLRCHSITYAPGGARSEATRRIAPRPLVAIFNGDFAHGGRVYRGLWMNLPKPVRATLCIDGEPVVEVDYPSCHLRLLLAAAGEGEKASDPNFDPYAIAGLDRRAVKLGVLILLNADDETEAEAALERRLIEKDLAATTRRRRSSLPPYGAPSQVSLRPGRPVSACSL